MELKIERHRCHGLVNHDMPKYLELICYFIDNLNTTSRFALKVDFASQQAGHAGDLFALVHVGILRRVRFESDGDYTRHRRHQRE